jgi:hypothetical protein
MILRSYREVIQESALNGSSVYDAFHNYLSRGITIMEALEKIIGDPVITESEADNLLSNVLFPEVIYNFAERFSVLDEDADVNEAWELFSEIEELSGELQNHLAEIINQTAEAYFTEEDAGDAVLTVDDWKKLTDEERADKVKAFLRALAGAPAEFTNLEPFIKQLDPGPDPYGNDRRAKKYKTGPYNRAPFNDDDDNETSKLNPANVPIGSEKHHSLPNLPIQENLTDPGSAAKVRRYQRWMESHLPKSQGYGQRENPADQLKAAFRLKTEAERKVLESKNDRDTDWTPIDKAEFIAKKRGNN